MKTAVLQNSVSVITSFGFIFFSTVFADNFLLLDLQQNNETKLRFVQHHIAKTLKFTAVSSELFKALLPILNEPFSAQHVLSLYRNTDKSLQVGHACLS